jgi:hypothetical protein
LINHNQIHFALNFIKSLMIKVFFMFKLIHIKKGLLLTSTCLLVCGISSAYAAGTASNTSVDTAMSVAFTISSTSQTDSFSSQTFKVARKIDVTVSTTEINTAEKIVIPSTTTNFATFTVTNNGNAAQSYTLVASIDDTASDIFVGTPTTTLYDAGVNTNCEAGAGDDVTYTVLNRIDLAVDASKKICVYSSTAAESALNTVTGEEATATLTATTTVSGTTTAVTEDVGINFNAAAGTPQIVFSDADGSGSTDTLYDGKHAAISEFQIRKATISISSNMIVVYDNNPGNTFTCSGTATGSLDDDKSIPGACMNFEYIISNATGGSAATNVAWTMTIPTAYLTYIGSSPGVNNSTICDGTGGFNDSAANTTGAIVCNIASLPANSSTKSVFLRATIK